MATKKSRSVKRGGQEGITGSREQNLQFARQRIVGQGYVSQRYAIKTLMHHVKGPAAAAVLIKALEDERISARNRPLAVEALGKIGGQASLRRLAKELENPSLRVRIKAHETLSTIGRPAIPILIGALEKAIEDSRSSTRWDVISSLVRIGDPVVDAMERLIKERRSSVGLDALEVLSNIGGERAIRAAMTGFTHSDERVRWQAIWTLNPRSVNMAAQFVPVKEREKLGLHSKKTVGRKKITDADEIMWAYHSKLASMQGVMQALRKLAKEDRSSRVRRAASDLLKKLEKIKKP